jgi:hypothetical protein
VYGFGGTPVVVVPDPAKWARAWCSSRSRSTRKSAIGGAPIDDAGREREKLADVVAPDFAPDVVPQKLGA